MGRMSELSAAVDEIRECGERLVGIADSLTQLYGRADESQKAATTSAQSKTPKPKPPTLEEVRGFLADKSRAGHTAAVKEIIRSHGAERLSDLDLAEFSAVLGKKRFEETLGGLIQKPTGKPVLVPQTDKRQEINITTAADDFADQENL